MVFAHTNYTDRRFVEFGASDGFYNSNTIVFERAFGWTGLLLEPDPKLSKLAASVRTSTVLNELVCNHSNSMMNFAEFAQMGLSGIFTDEQIKQLIKQRKAKGERAELLSKKALPCNLLSEVLVREKFNVTKRKQIDFMSIDVEGMEYEIVKTFPWHEWKVDVILIEVDKPGVAFKIREFFRSTGLYRKPFRIDFFHPDDIYVRNDVEIANLDSFQVGCSESCRKLKQCTSWKENERTCEH